MGRGCKYGWICCWLLLGHCYSNYWVGCQLCGLFSQGKWQAGLIHTKWLHFCSKSAVVGSIHEGSQDTCAMLLTKMTQFPIWWNRGDLTSERKHVGDGRIVNIVYFGNPTLCWAHLWAVQSSALSLPMAFSGISEGDEGILQEATLEPAVDLFS